MADAKQERSLFWDIIKGLGIIMIVFGHTGFPGGGFVYLFHLELFFLVTGYLYNEKKYGDDPFLYFARRFGGSWPRYMFYGVLLALLHNYCFSHQLLSGVQVLYKAEDFWVSALHSVFFQSPELLAGPMWFMPLWVIAATFFSGVIYCGRRTKKWKHVTIPVLTVAAVWLGQFLVARGMSLMYHIELSFVVLPFFVLGYYLRLYAKNLWETIPVIPAVGILLVATGLLYQCNRWGIFFDLASLDIKGLLFYPVVLLGFLWTFLLAVLVERVPKLDRFTAWIGRYSFDVMALHMLVFKGLDLCMRKWYYRDPSMDISRYPSPFAPQYGIAYTVLGVLIPVSLAFFYDVLKKKIQK